MFKHGEKIVEGIKEIGDAGDKLFTNKEERGKILNTRHKSDVDSDSWLAKNVRPLVFLGLFLLLASMVVLSGYGVVFSTSLFTMVSTLAASAFGYYFGERNARKAINSYIKEVKRENN